MKSWKWITKRTIAIWTRGGVIMIQSLTTNSLSWKKEWSRKLQIKNTSNYSDNKILCMTQTVKRQQVFAATWCHRVSLIWQHMGTPTLTRHPRLKSIWTCMPSTYWTCSKSHPGLTSFSRSPSKKTSEKARKKNSLRPRNRMKRALKKDSHIQGR